MFLLGNKLGERYLFSWTKISQKYKTEIMVFTEWKLPVIGNIMSDMDVRYSEINFIITYYLFWTYQMEFILHYDRQVNVRSRTL